MPFIQTITDIYLYGDLNLSLILFFVSMLLLLIGVGIKVWMEVVNLKAIERKPLNWIEMTHPHLPSLHAVVTLNVCILALVTVGLQGLRGTFPFNDAYEGLNLLTLFVLAGALGTLGELKWKGARMYAYAFILGTAFAFLTLTVFLTNPPLPLFERVVLGLSTILAALIPWHALGKGTEKVQAASVGTVVFFFWIFIYTLQ